jgi:hypothetical protein
LLFSFARCFSPPRLQKVEFFCETGVQPFGITAKTIMGDVGEKDEVFDDCEDDSLLSSPSRRKAPPALLSPQVGGTPIRQFVDYSQTTLSQAEGASGKALEDMLKDKPRPGDIQAWYKSLKVNQTENAVLEHTLISFGSIEALAKDQKHLDRENKKLRFREQRFTQEPLLRRRRLDMLPPALLKVMVVSLQNELAAANHILDHCHVAEHPLVVDKLPPQNKVLQQDLQKLLASGVAETTPFRASVADLSDRQRDLMLDALREQNRSLRSQIMRLQACLQGINSSNSAVMAGPEGSPRIMDLSRNRSRGALGSPEPKSPSSPNAGSPKQQRHKMLEERVRQSSLEIERLQQELLKTQEDLRRSENTVLAQLEIEAKMIEDKARLARQNSQLGTFVLRVLEDSHPRLAAQILRGRNLRGWYATFTNGEDFDEEAWLAERVGLNVTSEEEQSSVALRDSSIYRNSSGDQTRSSSRNDSLSGLSDTADSSTLTRGQIILTPGKKESKSGIRAKARSKPARPQSAAAGKRLQSSSKNPPQRPVSGSRTKKNNGRRSAKNSFGLGKNEMALKMEKLDPFEKRRKSSFHSPSLSARGLENNGLNKPVFHAEDVPASARLLQLRTEGEEGKVNPATEDQKVGAQQSLLPDDILTAITPVVIKFDRVLRQIFAHFARTQNKPIGTRNLFAEIAKWTSSLTHASFYKILKHYSVVPKLCSKKDAFGLLLGTNRELEYADFLARLVDIANISMKRLYVLADANSIAYLEAAFLKCARKLGLLVAFEGGEDSKINEEADENELGEKRVERSLTPKPMLTAPPPGVQIKAESFIDFALEGDAVLRSIFPEQTLENIKESQPNLTWVDLKSYWWKKCSNSRTPGIVKSASRDLPPEFRNPATSPPRTVSATRSRKILSNQMNLANAVPENQAKALELLCNFMVQTELQVNKA